MQYTAEHIDVEKFSEGLREHRNFQLQEKRLQQEKAQAFFDGYEKAVWDVDSMLHCVNYESKGKQTAAYIDGADNALYEICKELDVKSEDIRAMDISIDEKAELLAERIKAVCGQGDGE